MNNFFGQLYLDLSDHIKSTVPEIRWVDLDTRQLEYDELRPEVSFPAALIDFPTAAYSALSQNAQLGEVTIQIRLAFSPFSPSYAGAPLSVKEKALEYFTIEQKLTEALQGFTNGQCHNLVRQSITTQRGTNDEINMRIRIITFSTVYEDYSFDYANTHAATPEILMNNE